MELKGLPQKTPKKALRWLGSIFLPITLDTAENISILKVLSRGHSHSRWMRFVGDFSGLILG